MSFLSKIFGGTAASVISSVGGIVDDLHLSEQEKADINFRLQQVMLERDAKLQESIQSELLAKSKIIEAELLQVDLYTKRARPTVVYFGLVIIFFNYVLVPAVNQMYGRAPVAFELPLEFWVAWGGIVSTWVIGRTAEKRGVENRAVSVVTGASSIMRALTK